MYLKKIDVGFIQNKRVWLLGTLVLRQCLVPFFPHRTFSDLLDLSSLSFRHTTHVQQTLEEEQLGTERTLELYIPKE